MNNRKLSIVLATSEPEVASRMLKSIREKLPSYSIFVSVLFIGQDTKVDINTFPLPVTSIGTYKEYLSIADSRNICQLHLQEMMKEVGGIGMVLDDDLKWVMPEVEFSALCDQLVDQDCDMAFCAIEGDAPVPKEYTRASPLLDVLLAVASTNHSLSDLNKYIRSVSTSLSLINDPYKHHDFYSFNKNNFKREGLILSNINWDEFIGRLFYGKVTTREIVTPKVISEATGRERGGATIIFNSASLDFKNRSYDFFGINSRRSDMLMATDAHNSGLRLFNTPAVFKHNRVESFDSHDNRKLLGDILGYALIESYKFRESYSLKFDTCLFDRIQKTSEILLETSKMLTILSQWLQDTNSLSDFSIDAINSILKENKESLDVLHELDIASISISDLEQAELCA